MKKWFKNILPVFFCLLTAVAYAQDKKQPAPTADENILTENEEGYYSQVFGFNIPGIFNSRLYDAVSEWLGVPYLYAGKNINGIDCSGFVNMIYQQVYGVFLSGNSLDLFKGAKHLSKEKLAEGDLVFFKIHKRKVSHVGLYLGDNKFVHSSRSNGVIISDLNDSYYKKFFAGGGRVN